jgi:hypothetical protein
MAKKVCHSERGEESTGLYAAALGEQQGSGNKGRVLILNVSPASFTGERSAWRNIEH